MDMSQYKDLFVSESREYIRTINSLIVELEKDAGDREKIDTLFRATHSIKGMSASMDFGRISELAHRLEDLMTRVRKGDFPFVREVADLLLEGADTLDTMIVNVANGEPEGGDTTELMARIQAYEPGAAETSPAAGAEPEPEPVAQRETPRDRSDHRQTIRVKTALLDHLITVTGELVTIKHRLATLSRESEAGPLREAVTDLSRLVQMLHGGVMQARLIPFASISDRFPRIIRDLAKRNGKEIELVMEGGEIEIDRGILEELADPLVHILRNAVDHGLEAPGERTAAGKPTQGVITLRVRREKDQVIIVVADDGRGMDAERIKATAVAKGFITAEAAAEMPPGEAYLLTCQPGFSTAERVTDLSGRGVGMDVVRSTILSLCGTLAIESEPGHGTLIILRLPLTVAIINVLLIGCGNLTLAVPVMNILRTLELRRELIGGTESQKTFVLDDVELPLLSLNRYFGQPLAPVRGGSLPVFVCEVKGRRVGLAVDVFHGHQEVFVKPLGRPLDRLYGVAGGAILGSGEVIFILDVVNLF